MANPALNALSAPERRHLLRQEKHRRAAGEWPAWETLDFPDGIAAEGWPAQVRRAHRNWVFSVLERPVDGAVHFAVSSLSGVRPTFHEMQRIKNELAGEDATAIEIYPPHRELVDQADMFHIWIVPRLPFTIFEGIRSK